MGNVFAISSAFLKLWVVSVALLDHIKMETNVCHVQSFVWSVLMLLLVIDVKKV